MAVVVGNQAKNGWMEGRIRWDGYRKGGIEVVYEWDAANKVDDTCVQSVRVI
jgi:hypothetical protein